MTTQLSKAQIEAIKVELAKVGLNVTVKRQAKQDDKPLTVREILRKSKWYPAECAKHTRELNKPYGRFNRFVGD